MDFSNFLTGFFGAAAGSIAVTKFNSWRTESKFDQQYQRCREFRKSLAHQPEALKQVGCSDQQIVEMLEQKHQR